MSDGDTSCGVHEDGSQRLTTFEILETPPGLLSEAVTVGAH